MTVEKLAEALLSGDLITKSQLIEFGKICQMHILTQSYHSDNDEQTVRLVRNELITLRNELEFDDNKYYILTKNYSLN